MTTTILAPVDLSAATKTGPRVFRKQVLAKRTIQYPTPDGKTKTIAFDDAFLADLASSFTAGAYDAVPFILADDQNRHTMAPERFRGWVKGLEVTPDGLDAVIELSEDAAELVERTGGKLGVSARIKPVRHVDGRSFPRAINHVLGTLDPRLTGMRPWEPIDLSDPADDVLDLSGVTYQEGSTMPQTIDLSTLDPADADALLSFAAANGIDLSTEDDPDAASPAAGADEAGGDDTTDGDDEALGLTDFDSEDGITDAELDALIDAELADVSLSTAAGDDDDTDLSDPLKDDDTGGLDESATLDLAAGAVGVAGEEAQAERNESARLRFELAARDYAAAGVPPHIIDLAEPILSLSDDDAATIDLSTPTGEPVDVRGIVRDMLDAVKGTIDLSTEDGYGHENPDAAEGTDLADRWTAYLENN